MSDPIESTRERLLKHKGEFPAISKKAAVSYSWLSKFSRGDRGQRPGFDQMTKLTAALDELEAAQQQKEPAAEAGG